jgi:hypothetical protein
LHSGALKLFWPDHGHEQINEQQQGNDAHHNILHRSLLVQSPAKADKSAANDEKQYGCPNKNQVTHNTL